MSRNREKRVVPRFRRGNHSNSNVDIDDIEAQRRIDEDLKSVFIWSSDLPNFVEEKSFDDQNDDSSIKTQQFISDDLVSDQFDFQSDENALSTTNFGRDDQQFPHQTNLDEISTNFRDKYFHLKTSEDENQRRKFDLNEENSSSNRSLNFLNEKNNENHFDYQDDSHRFEIEQRFVHDQQFLHQMIYSINEEKTRRKSIVDDQMKILYDCQMKPKEIRLNLFHLLEDEIDEKKIFFSDDSNFILSICLSDQDQYSSPPQYSPLNSSIERNFDSTTLKSIQWSIEILNEKTSSSSIVRWSFSEDFQCHYSLLNSDESMNLFRLSIDENFSSRPDFYSLKDFQFDRSKIFSNLLTDFSSLQRFSFIDSILFRQNFGEDLSFDCSQWFYLQQLKSHFQRISFPSDLFLSSYSLVDGLTIDLKSIISFDDQMTQRYFRKYRCKHFSMKSDDKDQLDLNEINLTDEKLFPSDFVEQIQNDFNDDEENPYRDPIENYEKFNETNEIQFDFVNDENGSNEKCSSPHLRKCDFIRDPPPTWSRLRREIGSVSYNAAEDHPEYKLNKSNKKFIHLGKQRRNLSINIYDGYQQFIDKLRTNPTNYFRSFDNLDLRPLLFWYMNKQHLFSSNDSKLLKHPNFICRRLTLAKILANLYCDSQPWKLFVIRSKGQFYLSLSNRETRSVDQMTQDEYAGFHFESILTTEQPNSTRLKTDFPLKDPQKQFHSIQSWNFGKYNLLYSCEIDGEIHSSQISTIQDNEEEKSSEEIKEEQVKENIQILDEEEKEEVKEEEEEEKKTHRKEEFKSGYVEIKSTKRKVFYRDENKLHTLDWWSQMWLANVQHLIVGYKTNEGIIDQIDFLSQRQLISKFLSQYDLRLKYCLSYLYSFLELIERTVTIDDLQTIHCFAYIPQPIDTSTDQNLPSIVPFRYTQINRSPRRHETFFPQFYVEFLHRSNQDESKSIIDQHVKKRYSHRGRASCPLKQQQQQPNRRKAKKKQK